METFYSKNYVSFTFDIRVQCLRLNRRDEDATDSTCVSLPCSLQVNIVSCDGKCPSASIYNYNINTYARFCKCCRETGLQRRSVQLYCSGNATWVSYSIQEPTDTAQSRSFGV